MASTLLKNLAPGTSATTHVLTFRPKPVVVELHLRPDGAYRFALGRQSFTATRFAVQPQVRGLAGVGARLTGKQPPAVHVWITQNGPPVFVRFEGQLYQDGPAWRVELAAPRLE